MRTFKALTLFAPATILAANIVACAHDSTSLGGPDQAKAEGGTAQVAAACVTPASWPVSSKDDGVALATEAKQWLNGLAADETHAYYIARSQQDQSRFELKRVALAGGAAELVAVVNQHLGSVALTADSVLYTARNERGGTSAYRVAKTGGKSVEIAPDVPAFGIQVDTNGDVYLSILGGYPDRDVRVVKVDSNGKITPAVTAGSDVAPYGISRFAVSNGTVAWVPGQSGKLTKPDEPLSTEILGDAAVYTTGPNTPGERVALFGPYSSTSITALAMDSTQVYFGLESGLKVADIAKADSAKPFGPTEVPYPTQLAVDEKMVYWRTLRPMGSSSSSQLRAGMDAIGRVPKAGGAGEWLVESEMDPYQLSFAVGPCEIVWPGKTRTGDPTIAMRPKTIPGRNRPIPVAVATTPSAPATPSTP